jgi:hypothetical protein
VTGNPDPPHLIWGCPTFSILWYFAFRGL